MNRQAMKATKGFWYIFEFLFALGELHLSSQACGPRKSSCRLLAPSFEMVFCKRDLIFVLFLTGFILYIWDLQYGVIWDTNSKIVSIMNKLTYRTETNMLLAFKKCVIAHGYFL